MVNKIKKGTIISIYGMGHMGLPTAALLAKSGFQVIGADINQDTVQIITSGRSPIMEPGLDSLVHQTVKNGLLTATSSLTEASQHSQIHIVIVPTPVDDKKISDLKAVKNACKHISKGLKKGDLVIIESTVPPGTCNDLAIPILEGSGYQAGKDFGVAYTPERALPNNTIYEMSHNSRVIGGIDKWSVEMASSIYERITSGKIIKVRDIVTAEMVKLMENTYRDTNIALANEFALICDSLDIDAIEAIQAANHHPRVNIHTPGPGVGGHCLSIDPYFLVETAKKHGIDAPLIKTSRKVNEHMPLDVALIVNNGLKAKKKNIEGSEIGILGVAYKGNVADARETPAKTLIRELKSKGATVYAHDPFVPPEIIKSLGSLPVDMERVLECDCVVLMTDHDYYLELKPPMIKKGLLVCTRPILNPEVFKDQGVIFKGVGRS